MKEPETCGCFFMNECGSGIQNQDKQFITLAAIDYVETEVISRITTIPNRSMLKWSLLTLSSAPNIRFQD